MLQTVTKILTPSSEGLFVRIMVYVFGASWKSSLAGFLGLLIVTFSTINLFLAQYVLQAPQTTQAKIGWVTLAINLLLAIMRGWVMLITKDAGIMVGTEKNSDQLVVVPAHEVPFDKSVKPTKE